MCARALPEANTAGSRGSSSFCSRPLPRAALARIQAIAIAVPRHEALLHAAARAHPHHVPAAARSSLGDREPGEDVPAGAARHDEDRFCAHAFSPLDELAVLPVDAQQDRERDAVRDQAGAAEAQQRQREALGRQQAHVHAHVDERLDAEPDADALRDERGEVALVQARPGGRWRRRAARARRRARSPAPRRRSRAPRRSPRAGSRCAPRAGSAASPRCAPRPTPSHSPRPNAISACDSW